jgi:hypothetical protein
MTRTGASKAVDPTHASGRLRKAEAFHEASRVISDNIASVRDGDVVTANVVLAAIAYTDALTAAYGGRVNQKDHAAAVKLLRDVLGKALPDAQERRLARLLGRKDETAYGASIGRTDEALQTVENLDQFGSWAKSMLAAKRIVIAPRNDAD